MKEEKKSKSGWLWIPTLYISESIAFIIITVISVLMYQNLGVNYSDSILYTSFLYIPWLIKPLWSPLIDVIGSKRSWILFTQFLIAVLFAITGLLIQLPDFFQFTIIVFWLLAFIAATQDVAIDGFYIVALKDSNQSLFIGLRNSFYKIALVGTTTIILLVSNQVEKLLSVAPVEFKVVANPNKFFEESIKVDSLNVKEQAGPLKLISNTNYLEISTKPKSKDQVVFYTNFARNMNMMNGFINQAIILPDTTGSNDLVGNIGLIKFRLSKKPDDNDEFIVKLKFIEGDQKFKVIEGDTLKFTSLNWNKPAFAVIQIDSNITSKYVATFSAGVDKFSFGWSVTFGLISLIFFLFFIYHKIVLPYSLKDEALIHKKNTTFGKEFFRSFARYFEKKKIIQIILFLLLYLFARAQITKIIPLFLSDETSLGGLSVSVFNLKIIKGIVTVLSFAIGNIIAGIMIYKKGLKSLMTIFTIMMNIPLVVYIYLSWFQPVNFWIISTLIAIDNFGFGFGFALIIMYMINVSEGDYPASHFSISFGFMSLGLLLSEMLSFVLKDSFGYKYFFIWVLITSIPSFILIKLIPIEYNFGKKKITEI
ncbi:MAG: MFS transporter [Melioribacteraceae bacterium]|nr:MFS transporter [Melioribacteraceae bacterium]